MEQLIEKPNKERLEYFCKQVISTLPKNSTKLRFDKIETIDIKDPQNNFLKNNYYIVHFWGGLNGSGKWSNYLNDLSQLLLGLEEFYQDIWVIDFNIDVLDDVFDIQIGVK